MILSEWGHQPEQHALGMFLTTSSMATRQFEMHQQNCKLFDNCIFLPLLEEIKFKMHQQNCNLFDNCIFLPLLEEIKFKMKVLLDIHDNKASSIMEVLKSISYVKTKKLTDSKAQLMLEIREAVEEMKLIRSGKKKARDAEDFLNEL